MDIVKKAELFAQKEYQKNDPRHRWPHVQAVLKKALEIAKNFKEIDYEALKLAIIFHDINYASYEKHVGASIQIAEKFLKENNYPKDRIEKVKEIILNHSTLHRKKFGEAKLLEGKIIYDSDKSLCMTNKEKYQKYSPLLYFKKMRRFVKS